MRRENRDHRVPGESADYRAARDRLLDQEIKLPRLTEAMAVSQAGAAHGRTDPAGPRPRWRRSRWRSEERETIGAIQTGQAQPRHLQPHVPARSRRPLRRARDRQHRAPAPKGRPVPIMHRAARPTPRCRRARHPAHQPRRPREHVTPTAAHLRPGARLASPSPPVPGRQHLQPRVPPRPGHNPSLLELKLFYAPTDSDQDPRHISTLEPLWNLLDLTPDGRPSGWHEQLNY